jgi:hypothetical protein
MSKGREELWREGQRKNKNRKNNKQTLVGREGALRQELRFSRGDGDGLSSGDRVHHIQVNAQVLTIQSGPGERGSIVACVRGGGE